MKNESQNQNHCDTSSVFVAVIGRPNVGKSSLTNLLVGEKVAIVTSKPQTTRTRITGVITRGPLQYVLLDTPVCTRLIISWESGWTRPPATPSPMWTCP